MDVYGWLDVKRAFDQKYKHFLAFDEDYGQLEVFYGKNRLPPVLGAEEFATEARGRVINGEGYHYEERQTLKSLIDRIIDAVVEHCGVAYTAVCNSRKGRGAMNDASSVAMYLC